MLDKICLVPYFRIFCNLTISVYEINSCFIRLIQHFFTLISWENNTFAL